MNRNQWIAAIALVDFASLELYALSGGWAAFQSFLAHADIWTEVLFVDLVIALSLALVWVFKDAKARGLSPWPYAALTLCLGSVGPLAYIIRREAHAKAQAPAAPAPALSHTPA